MVAMAKMTSVTRDPGENRARRHESLILKRDFRYGADRSHDDHDEGLLLSITN
jgi:hypothetical protein